MKPSRPDRKNQLAEEPLCLELRVLPAGSSLLLSDLNGTNGATFLGIDTAISSPADFGDRSGWSVSGVGDINGDGFDDMFVSAPFADGDPNSVSTRDSGECYLVFGKADWSMTSSMSFSSLNGTNGVIFYGIDLQDRAGDRVSGAGDVNHDGFADLLIGAPLGDGAGNGTQNAGETYLVFGKSDWTGTPAVDLSSLDGTTGVTFYGVDAGDENGSGIRGVGDINNDGIDDFMIGANSTRGLNNSNPNNTLGEAYLIFGKMDWSSTPTFNLSTLNGTNGVIFYGSNVAGELFGKAGDVNGDGFSDILINSSGNGSREACIVFGKSDWSMTTTIDLFTVAEPLVIRFIWTGSNDSPFVSAGRGDVNGDGYDDILIGLTASDGPNNSKPDSGESYLIFGRPDWSNPPTLSNPNGIDVVRFYGVDSGDFAGNVSIAGDLNGDGFDDLTITALLADGATNTSSEVGEVYVVYGKANWQFTPSLNLSALDGNNGYTIYGIDLHDRAGIKSGAGDVNGDGFDDLLIGAFQADSLNNAINQAGEAYVVFGFDTSNPVIDQVGVRRGDTFYQDANNSFSSNSGDAIFHFGNSSDVPLVGDWNNDGFDEIGIWRNGLWYLDLNGNNVWNGTGGGDIVFSFGNSTDTPLVGDWNGDGTDDVGVKRGSVYYLDANENHVWNGTGGGDSLFSFGNSTDIPVVGDWNGNGHDKIGIFRNGTFYLDQNGNGVWNDIGGGDSRFGYGTAGDKPVVGDWNGDGVDDVGIMRGNAWYLDQNGNRAWNGTIGGDALFVYGNSTDTPIIGRWKAPAPGPVPSSVRLSSATRGESSVGSSSSERQMLDTLFSQLAVPVKKVLG